MREHGSLGPPVRCVLLEAVCRYICSWAAFDLGLRLVSFSGQHLKLLDVAGLFCLCPLLFHTKDWLVNTLVSLGFLLTLFFSIGYYVPKGVFCNGQSCNLLNLIKCVLLTIKKKFQIAILMD